MAGLSGNCHNGNTTPDTNISHDPDKSIKSLTLFRTCDWPQKCSRCVWPHKVSIFVNGLTKSTLECPDKIIQDVVTHLTKVLRMLWLTDKNAQDVVTHWQMYPVSCLTRMFRMLWLIWWRCSGCNDSLTRKFRMLWLTWQRWKGCCDSPDKGGQDVVTLMTRISRMWLTWQREFTMLWLTWQELSGWCDWPDKGEQDVATHLIRMFRMLRLIWQRCSECCDSRGKGIQDAVTHLTRVFRMLWLAMLLKVSCGAMITKLPSNWLMAARRQGVTTLVIPSSSPPPPLPTPPSWVEEEDEESSWSPKHTQFAASKSTKLEGGLALKQGHAYTTHQIPKYQFWWKFTNVLPKKLPQKVINYCSVHFSLLQNDLCCYSTDGILSTDGKIWCLINPAILTHHQHMKHHHLQTDTHVQSLLKSTPLAMHQDLSDTMSAKHRDPAVFCCLIHHSRPETRTCVCLTSTRNLLMSGLTWSSGTWAAAGDWCLAVWPADRGVSWATCTLLTYTATL